MFCTECGYENDDDAKFCRKCGSPLDSLNDNEFSEKAYKKDNKTKNTKNERQQRTFNKSSNANQQNNNLKIIIPIVIIGFIILVVGVIFMIDSDSKLATVDDVHESMDTSNYNSQYNAHISIDFTPLKDINHIKYISTDNTNYVYTDGSTKDGVYTNETEVYLGALRLDYDMFKAEINEDMNLKKDVQYTIKYDTKLEPNQWHKHIKGDIIVHTAIDGDITIPFDKEVTPI